MNLSFADTLYFKKENILEIILGYIDLINIFKEKFKVVVN